MPHKPEDIAALVSAVEQVLADMGTGGTCCCLAAKADLRIAFEPFAAADPGQWSTDGLMPLAEALEIQSNQG